MHSKNIVPIKCPKMWDETDHRLLLEAESYLASPTPASRATILSERLVDLAKKTQDRGILNLAVDLLQSPILAKGKAVEQWAIYVCAHTKDEELCRNTAPLAKMARQTLLEAQAQALLSQFEKHKSAMTPAMIELAIRAEHVHPQETSCLPSLIDRLASIDTTQAIDLQNQLYKNWTPEVAQVLAQIYNKFNAFDRTRILSKTPIPEPPHILPFLATQTQITTPTFHETILDICLQLNSPACEPILLTILDSPHAQVLSKASQLAHDVGTRKCLSKMEIAKENTTDQVVSNKLLSAIDAIKTRHPHHNVDTGALSLSETHGEEGALSLTDGPAGAISLYDQVATHIRSERLPMKTTPQDQLIRQWEHLGPAPRPIPRYLYSQLFFTMNPWLIGCIVIINVAGIIALFSLRIFSPSFAMDLGSFLGMCLLLGYGGNFVLLPYFRLKKTLREGQLVHTKIIERTDSRHNNDPQVKQFECVNMRNEKYVQTSINADIMSGLHSTDVGLMCVDKHNSLLLLRQHFLSLDEHGQIQTSPIWLILGILLIISNVLTFLLFFGIL